ncbi:hypothetical protein [Streptomyces sp. A1136]|uniref:hypothetical protein n=1 Tax=Streptomyces sp. A1136 TaxID=2563102 RepID=UPI00109E5B26|nr:hypothetical protein [Streptomyces sp. A1136]THA56512.1 hypothetical protein E6R62_09795 [Streptomyces sp. A1136]
MPGSRLALGVRPAGVDGGFRLAPQAEEPAGPTPSPTPAAPVMAREGTALRGMEGAGTGPVGA